MAILDIPTARVFAPLLKPSRYKGAHGGRGSGKSHFFCERIIEDSIAEPGLRTVCIREVQKTLDQSVKRLIEDKLEKFDPPGFDVLRSEIKTPGGGVIIFQGMQDYTAASIKSLEGFGRAFVEEAQTLSQRSLDLLRPTIRKPGSELWFGWNPENEFDPVDKFLRGPSAPADAIVVRANWSDNPWLPQELRDEIELDRHDSEKFAWVWEGAYRRAVEGAYYADGLAEADKAGRVMPLAIEPLLPVKAFWDLGIADSMAIWVAQWVGREIRWLDYIEGQGQPLAYYTAELRKRGWNGCECVLPHDGVRRDMITGHRFSDHLRDAGFSVRVIENQGRGAAMLRIEAGRRLFPRMAFDADKTRHGRKTLALYHERRDEDRGGIGLGPEHDASSHCGDAFGLGCIAYEEPQNAGRDWKFESRAVY